jgi:uncharacterized membrane protein YeaQ/YmgE (transglycosylase-associated protein family)
MKVLTMDTANMIKAGIVGGIVAIILEALAHLAFPTSTSTVYIFGFIVLLIGGFVAGWLTKEKPREGTVSGILAGLVYVILGLFVIYPLLSKYHTSTAGAGIALVFGIVLGAVGGFLGKCLHPSMMRHPKPAKTSTKKSRKHSRSNK